MSDHSPTVTNPGPESEDKRRTVNGSGAPGAKRPQRHRPSQICRLERVAAPGIIALRRNSSAHLHRPWRGNGGSVTTEERKQCAKAIPAWHWKLQAAEKASTKKAAGA